MKNLFLYIIILLFAFAACNTGTSKTNESKTAQVTENKEQLYACSMHPEVRGKKGDKCSKCGMELSVPVKDSIAAAETEPAAPPAATNDTANNPVKTKTSVATSSSFSINEIVSNYLKLKNALARDDARGAADAGKAMVTAIAKSDATGLSAQQKKIFTDITDDAKEHGEHIGENAGKIEHQREHFAMLSKDVNDLLKTFVAPQKLYQDYCPMYDDGKGAVWISEIKEIKNPYFGSKMPTCGSVKKVF
jgi:Protein of unknown function (DUF3347)/Heavy metal binding domain